jgi:hypothetical protein
VQLSSVPSVVFYPVIVVRNLTSGFLQTKHLRNGEQWKLTDAVIKTYDFDRTYMFISQGPGGGKGTLPMLLKSESFSSISDIHSRYTKIKLKPGHCLRDTIL